MSVHEPAKRKGGIQETTFTITTEDASPENVSDIICN